jgi:hypothetical protein
MANEIIGIKPEVTLTCQALLQEWLAHHSGKHARNVKADWENHILPKLRNVQAMKVTSGMVEEIRTAFLNSPCLTNTKGKVAEQIRVKIEKARLNGEKVVLSPLKRHSNAGANKVLRHLYFVFGWGVKTERIPRLPFRKLKELIEQEPVRTFLRPEQVRPFLAQLDSLGNLPVMVAVSLHGGGHEDRGERAVAGPRGLEGVVDPAAGGGAGGVLLGPPVRLRPQV